MSPSHGREAHRHIQALARRNQAVVRLGMVGLTVAMAAFTAGCPSVRNLAEDPLVVIGARRSPTPIPTGTSSGFETPDATASATTSPSPTPSVSSTPTPTPTPTPSASPGTSDGLDVRTLDMAPNSWAPYTPMSLARQGLVAVDGGDRLFVLTGDGALTDETYTFATGRWQRYYSSFAGLGTNLYFAGAAMVNSTIAVIGGMGGDEWGANYTGLALPTLDSQQAPVDPDFPSALLQLSGSPVYAMGVAALDGKLYVAGGRDLSSVKSASYVFSTLSDPKPSAPLTQARVAQPIAPLKAPRAGLGLAAVNGRVYAIGGYTLADPAADTPTPDTLVQVYDPNTNTWLSSADPGGPARMPSARHGFAVAALNNRIYVVGGKNAMGATLRTVEAYDPATNAWSTLAPMPTARSILALVAHQGRLYALGGADASGRACRVVEVYAP